MDDRRTRTWLRLCAHALMAASISFASSGCETIPALSHKAVLTPEEQSGLGAIAVSELLSTSKLSTDQQQLGATDAVGQRLAAASGRNDLDWEFKVVAHARPLTVALPDGTVLVTSAQLARCRTEAELAAALSKEMGCMLAGVYPSEVTSPWAGAGYTPLTIEALTPADQSTAKVEDLVAADSIGLSMLARAGYDPGAAARGWIDAADGSRPNRRLTTVDARRAQDERKRTFTSSLAHAQTVYEHHTAKIGAGNVLAFAPPPTVQQPLQAEPAALEWVSPPALTGPPSNGPPAHGPPVTGITAPAAVLPGSNNAVVSSDGEFLPPTIGSGRPGDGNWSSAPIASEPPVIEQTSFEQPQAPSFGPALP